ncbi:MAG: transcription antitermination factor NusB [candidate division Zixibacteria bacterium]
MGSSSRSLARQLVLQALYAAESGPLTPDDCLASLVEESEINARHAEYAAQLMAATLENASASSEAIGRLAVNWELNRIAIIDRLVMQLAMTELEKMPDIPVKVVLDEAIELAKMFSTEQSSAFVNGILDKYVQNMAKEQSS